MPVVLLIAAGFVAGKRDWIIRNTVKDLSNLVFFLLSPALLFKAMSAVDIAELSFAPVAAYFLGAGLIFWGTLLLGGFVPRTAVLALANTYSNTVMIGIPLIGLAYGPTGMVTLLTLVSVHSLVILTTATLVLELTVARAARQTSEDGDHSMLRTVLGAARNAIIHPVPIPIIAGLVFAQTGWQLPAEVDKPLQMLGQAFGPMALVLVGVTLAHTAIGAHLGAALRQALIKNLLHPLLVAGAGYALGLHGLPLTVMIVAASLPIGANVFLFSQRYAVAEELITASVAVSTALALVTVTLCMTLLS